MNAHQRLGVYAFSAQVVREMIRLPIEVPIGHPAILEHDGDLIRRLRDLVLKLLLNGALSRIRTIGSVQHPDLFLGLMIDGQRD